MPFYLYEFKARTGYSIPLSVIERLGDRVASKSRTSRSRPSSPICSRARRLHRRGDTRRARSRAAPSVRPRGRVSEGGAEKRAVLERFPFQSALKTVLSLRGLPVRPDVRAPLRTLDPEERAELEQWLGSS